MTDYCCVSSFDHEALREIEAMSNNTLTSIYLTNYWNTWQVPEDCHTYGHGVNVASNHITQELVDKLHKHGKLIVAWVDTTAVRESPEMFCKMMDLGIDSYCTDFPTEVQTVWRNYK